MLLLREAVSLLLANGHLNAQHYPVGRIFLEADIVRKRLARERAEESSRMNLCVGALFDEKIGEAFRNMIREMTGGR